MTQQEAIDLVDISREEFLEFFESHRNASKTILAKGDNKGFMPVVDVLAIDVNGNKKRFVFFCDCDFNEWDEKAAFMHLVAENLFDSQLVPVAACMSAEVWMSIQQLPQSDETVMRPRDDPNRKEAVQACGMTFMKGPGNDIGVFEHCLIMRASDNTMLNDGEFKDRLEGIVGKDLQFNLLAEIALGFRDIGIKKFGQKVTFPNN